MTVPSETDRAPGRMAMLEYEDIYGRMRRKIVDSVSGFELASNLSEDQAAAILAMAAAITELRTERDVAVARADAAKAKLELANKAIVALTGLERAGERYQRAFAEGVEAAAKVALDAYKEHDWTSPYRTAAEEVAVAIRALSPQPVAEAVERLPQDVVNLVIAARVVAFSGEPTPEAILELDVASEAFASRVPWEDQPSDDDWTPRHAALARQEGKNNER